MRSSVGWCSPLQGYDHRIHLLQSENAGVIALGSLVAEQRCFLGVYLNFCQVLERRVARKGHRAPEPGFIRDRSFKAEHSPGERWSGWIDRATTS